MPCISHAAMVPSFVFCHTRSANPSPLTSPVPAIFHVGSAGARVSSHCIDVMVLPRNVQIARDRVVCDCHTASDIPSLLKSVRAAALKPDCRTVTFWPLMVIVAVRATLDVFGSTVKPTPPAPVVLAP